MIKYKLFFMLKLKISRQPLLRLIFILFLVVAKFNSQVKAANLEICGIISATLYKDSSKISISTNWFIVELSGNKTWIKAGPMGDPIIRDFEYGLLDKYSYVLINYNTNKYATEAYQVTDGHATKIKLEVPQKGVNTAMMFVNSGRVPEYGFGLLNPVWLAYCSHLDLADSISNSTGYTPIFSMGSVFRENGGLANIQYILNSNAPHFLQNLVESGDFKRFDALDLPAPSTGFFTNAFYAVANWTNIANLTVPQKFYATNLYVMGGFGVVKSARIIYEGTTLNIKLNGAIPSPMIPSVTRIVERRSAFVKPLLEFSYTTTNGILMNREKLILNENYEAEMSEKALFPTPLSQKAYLKRRIVLYTFFGLLAILPIVILMLASKSKLAQASMK